MPLLTKQPQKTIGLKKAMEAMRKPDTRLLRMRSEHAADGFAFYVVPGGPVERWVAERIMTPPLVRAGHDGLFPGHDQTWRMVGND